MLTEASVSQVHVQEWTPSQLLAQVNCKGGKTGPGKKRGK